MCAPRLRVSQERRLSMPANAPTEDREPLIQLRLPTLAWGPSRTRSMWAR
jgi:hypothetical protein